MLAWRRKWQPTPVFLPGESHGQRSLVGYSPRGCKESDTTERLHFHFSLSCKNRASLVAQIVKNLLALQETPSLIPGSGRYPGEGIGYPLQCSWTSLVAQMVKNPPEIWETWVQTLGWEDSLEKERATCTSILAWRIPMGREAWWAAVHGVTKNRT